MSNDVARAFTDWIGREVVSSDILSSARASALAASLDCTEAGIQAGQTLHPGWHWIFFHSVMPLRELGEDGHNRLGTFLPPLPSACRMWAGGRLHIVTPLRVGEPAERRSAILSIKEKVGKSGKLFFVTVRHNITCRSGGLMVEDHDIVYRVRSGLKSGVPAAPARLNSNPEVSNSSSWSERVTPSAIQLFRYSALTFNSHRIHYDADYARTQEGYPGVVVHGPLVAIFLLELLRKRIPGCSLIRFSYRAMSPAFLGENIVLSGRPEDGLIRLWASSDDGRLVMQSEAEIS